ncbi:hypothetical protein OG21DRAFT_1487780 [Imleria badia]|nr:hypothetical protein OG21DRAFT_1487780 [Imleria badia]
MVLLRSRLTTAFAAFSLLGSSLAIPLVDKLSPDARELLKISRMQSSDALSFYLTSGPSDMAQAWQDLSQSQRISYLDEYNKAGISVIVSAFGETDTPTSSGTNAVAIADKIASWVKEYGLQGVDVDYDDFGAFDGSGATAEPWLIFLTQQLRKKLPQGEYILSHAPVAPWFTPNMWSGGGYLQVHKNVGNLIDWARRGLFCIGYLTDCPPQYNIQFYNQGTKEYTTCEGLFHKSLSNYPESSLFQSLLMVSNSTSLCLLGVSEAHSSAWDAGVMVWEYPDAPSNWITSVRGT